MILITGGAYHGKRNYAKQMYPGIDFVEGISCAEETIFACQGMDHFHSYIENRMREGKKLPELLKIVEKLKYENSEIVLITDEIGYGIVPTDAFYRERSRWIRDIRLLQRNGRWNKADQLSF